MMGVDGLPLGVGSFDVYSYILYGRRIRVWVFQSGKVMDPSPNSGGTDSYPLSYVTCNEMKSTLHWFGSWSPAQREHFLQDLVGKAVPGKICLLLDGLGRLGMDDRAPNIFQCQLRLWDQWFANWTEHERNEFLRRLEDCDPTFVSRFYKEVAGTAGKD